VPDKARWNQGWEEAVVEQGKTKIIKHPALKHVKENVGSRLNKALKAIEDENPEALERVFRRLEKKGRVLK
jgi:type I restriction enzyme M protein